MSESREGMGMSGSKEGMSMNGSMEGKMVERIHGGKNGRMDLRREIAKGIHGGKRLGGSMETGKQQKLQSCVS